MQSPDIQVYLHDLKHSGDHIHSTTDDHIIRTMWKRSPFGLQVNNPVTLLMEEEDEDNR